MTCCVAPPPVQEELEDRAATLFVLHEHGRLDWLDYGSAPRKHLQSMTDQECEQRLRFRSIAVVLELRQLLKIPEKVVFGDRKIISGDDALMILLAFMAQPLTLDALAFAYGRRPSAISELVHHLLDHIYDRFYVDLLLNIGRWEEHFPTWADAVDAKVGVDGGGIVAFLDGSCIDVCRPSYGQDAIYNGKDRTHCLKVIVSMAPNGITAFAAGPFAGSQHDASAYDESQLESRMDSITGRWLARGHPQYSKGADKAFRLSRNVTPLFKPADTAAKVAFNTAYSKPRTSVEWGFGVCGNLWPRMKWHRKLKIFQMPVAKMFFVAQILTNAHACEYGNLVSSYFGMAGRAPSMQDYLGDLTRQVPL